MSISIINAVLNLSKGVNPYSVIETYAIHHQNFMYPPLMMFIYFPLVYFFGNLGYFITNVILFIIGSYYLYSIFFHFTKNKFYSRGLLVLFSSLPLFIYEIFYSGSNDLVPIVFLLISFYYFLKLDFLSSASFFAFSFLSKIYSIVLLPFIMIYLFMKKKYLLLFKFLMVFLSLVILISLPFFLWSADDFIEDMSYQTKRPLDNWEQNFSIQNILFGNYFFIVHFLVLALLYLFYFLNKVPFSSYFIALLIFIFILFSKTFHSNYTLFFLPFIFIYFSERYVTVKKTKKDPI